MINNFEQINTLLDFPSDDNFYIVDIIQRKKDNPLIERNMNMLRTWYINNPEGLSKLQLRIMEMCNHYNARAYIRLNVRSYRKVALEALRIIASHIAAGMNAPCANAFASAAGLYHSDPFKKWLIDVDEPLHGQESKLFIPIADTIIEICNDDPNWDKDFPIISRIPTKNGYHLITLPFNQQKFKEKYPEIEIHKDNPTVLYIP